MPCLMARADCGRTEVCTHRTTGVQTAAIRESSVMKDRKVKGTDRIAHECQRPCQYVNQHSTVTHFSRPTVTHLQEGDRGGAVAAGPARGLARRRLPPCRAKFCRVVGGDIDAPLPYGRGRPGNMPGEARRRRHGISGIPVTADSTVKCNTRPSSQ